MNAIIKTLSPFVAGIFLSNIAAAQAPSNPPPVYTGSFGGGLAITSGNTDTQNFNLTAALVRDPKTRNVIKGGATYLRGEGGPKRRFEPGPNLVSHPR
jgi:hypothetical protein